MKKAISLTNSQWLKVKSDFPAYVMRSLVKRNVLEKQIAHEVTPYEGRILYTFGIDISMQGRGCKFDYKNMWMEEYNTFEKGSLVLFNVPRFAKQWEGKNPMINWNKINKNHALKVLIAFDDGWKLYEIK